VSVTRLACEKRARENPFADFHGEMPAGMLIPAAAPAMLSHEPAHE